MKKFLLIAFVGFVSISFGQITPNGNSGSSTTAYTDASPNDPIYIWCGNGLSSTPASLTAVSPSGVGPFTFRWFYHNQTNSSWTSYTTQTGVSSTVNNLASDGYRVEIYDDGAAGALVACYVAWVWNMTGDVTTANTPSACDATGLNGGINVNGSFTYYNPPPPQSLINAGTQINICFSATHTYVSDLAFYLKGPPSCGSPTVLLSPNPGANGQGATCNSGDNVNNLCFTNTSSSILNVCTASTPLSGTYGGYGAGVGTLINWAPLIGCNTTQGNWTVQIYDCIGQDVGSLTNATLSFSNLTSVCGSPTSVTYTSGAINSAINDNSCSAATASIFQVPVPATLTTPIVINASTSYLWTSTPSVTIPNASTSLTPAVTGLPTGSTNFTLTATVTYGSASCTYANSTSFTNTCCSATADAGPDRAFCSGSSAQIGTPAVAGMTYSWSPATGLSDPTSAQPTVNTTNATGAPITTTYTLTVTNVASGGCTANDAVDVTVNPIPVVTSGTYGPFCIDNGTVNLSGTPAGGTFSGTGVTGTNFDPTVGTQTITYSYTDVNNCSNSATTQIVVNLLPVVDAGANQTICFGTSVTLSGTGASTYSWSPAVTNGVPFVPALGQITYYVTGTDANGCVEEDSVIIGVLPQPIPVVIADSTIGYPGLQVNFTNGSSLATTYSWSFGDGSTSTVTNLNGATHTYNNVGTYPVLLTASNGVCANTDTVVIVVTPFPPPVIHIPNVFTPNKDGVNDEFFIDVQNIASLEMIVINRWGNLVFETSTINNKWDGKINGKDADEGVYFIKYSLVDLNGEQYSGHGNVTLLR